MNGIQLVLQIILFQLLFLQSLFAQTPEKKLAEMSWQELIEQWEAYAEKDQNTKALVYARAALENAFRDSSETSLAYGNSLDYLGYSLHHTGQHAEAERCLLAAVEHARAHLGKNHEDYITRLSNLAMLHMDMGELAKSVSELEAAVHLAAQALDKDNPFVPIMINNLGLAYEKTGSLDRALVYYLEALELTAQTLGTENVRYGIRLSNIAAVHRKTGKNEQALDYSLRALAIFEQNAGKNSLLYAAGLNGLINTYIGLSRVEEAIPLGDSLLVLLEKRARNETPEMYDYTASIANLYYHTGEYERCANYCKQSLTKYQAIFPKLYSQHTYMARLAMVALEKQNKLEEAAAYTLIVNQYSLAELRENFSKFSEDEQLQIHLVYRQWAEADALLFVIRHPEFSELAAAAYDYQMTVKGLSLANRYELFQSLRKNPDALLFAQFEDWQRLQNNISKQYALTPARRQNDLDSLLVQSNELERSLAIGSESFRMTRQTTRWQDVQAALEPGEAAIEFGQLKGVNTDSMLYAAWIIRPGDTAPKQVFLFEEKEMGDLIATQRLYAYAHGDKGINLRELLWQPLMPFLDGVSTLYFAPAGILHLINLAAVPISDHEILADRFKVHRLVSTRNVVELKKKQNRVTPQSALIFGGIRYEADSVALLANNTAMYAEPSTVYSRIIRGNVLGRDWEFLSGSLVEALAVETQLKRIGANIVLATGINASEGLFKRIIQKSPSPAVLHLATHGFFLTIPDSNAHSGFSASNNPMVRSGLVLAGANRAWSGATPIAGQEDGILTAMEISRLDLSGTELAVLSACGTGKGSLAAGEGVLGLQRAFKMAGTHYIIMTLWDVQDHDAQQFMNLFYDEWLTQKKDIPDAFRAAQLEMCNLHSKPFQPFAWAGFVLLE